MGRTVPGMSTQMGGHKRGLPKFPAISQEMLRINPMTTNLQLPEDAGQWCWHPAPRSALDQIANDMERRWGVDRLPRLVSPETAARFNAARDIHGAGPTDTRSQVELDAMMARAWAALDAEATQRGASPLPPAIHEIPIEGCPGAVAAICLDDEHAQAVLLRAKAEGRCVSVWTLAECVRVIQANELVNRIKDKWPGAVVLPAKAPRVRLVDDAEIPFGGSDDE